MRKKKAVHLYKKCRKQGWNKGSALVLAIFLSVSIPTGILSSLQNLMRVQRNVQHVVEEMRLSWTSEAMVDRTLKLLQDYVDAANGEFPDVVDSKNNVIGGNDTDAMRKVTGGKNFDEFLKDYFSKLRTRHLTPKLLQNVALDKDDIQIKASETPGVYAIQVTARDSRSSAFKTSINQNVIISYTPIFNLSIFCEEDCEWTAGPSSVLQGPIHANKSFYIMNHEGSTLTFEMANRFDDASNPEPYIMHAVDQIYFHFKRLIGPNYLLTNSAYFNSVPNFYKFADASKPSAIDPNTGEIIVHTPEVFPGLNLGPNDNPKYPPYFYYGQNETRCEVSTAPGRPACQTNYVRVENTSGGYDWLSSSMPTITPRNEATNVTLSGDPNSDVFYSFAPSAYTGGSKISVSSAFNENNFPLNSNVLPPSNPFWAGYTNTTVIPSGPHAGSKLVESGPNVATKTLKIFGKDVTGSAHAYIEPISSSDSPEVAKEKFHGKADLVLTRSSNHLERIREPDYRQGNSRRIQYELNLDQLMKTVEPDPTIIYFDSGGSTLKIFNGHKLPKKGLTIASSGRVWIQGDYNIFEYDNPSRHDPSQSGHPCTPSEWEQETCHVPPAAIFSDSFGVLSKEWFGYNVSTPRNQRQVHQDVMVNTALATGFRQSELQKNYDLNYIDNCTRNPNSTECLANGRNVFPGVGNRDRGNLYGPNGAEADNNTFRCPNRTYLNRNINDTSCEYYQESANNYRFYINTRSNFYQNAIREQTGNAICDRSIRDIRNPNHCNNKKIPIFADPSSAGNAQSIAVPPFPGVAYRVLDRGSLQVWFDNEVDDWKWRCDRGVLDLPAPPGPVPDQTQIDHDANHCEIADEGHRNCQVMCVDGNAWIPAKWVNEPKPGVGGKHTPVKAYHWPPVYKKLYTVKYSGGLENLINLQEDWEGTTLRFMGTLTAPWTTGNRLAFFSNSDYYVAPRREFQYNEDLTRIPPPGTPDLISSKRSGWKREF